jgi:predicted transcriptional regulator
MKEQVAEIVAAYVGHNTISPDQLPALITTISQALAGLGQEPAAAPASPLTPAVPIRRSVGDDAITCLDCGGLGQTGSGLSCAGPDVRRPCYNHVTRR